MRKREEGAPSLARPIGDRSRYHRNVMPVGYSNIHVQRSRSCLPAAWSLLAVLPLVPPQANTGRGMLFKESPSHLSSLWPPYVRGHDAPCRLHTSVSTERSPRPAQNGPLFKRSKLPF